MKKLLSLIVPMTLIFSNFGGVTAKKEVDTPTVIPENAVYLSGDFYGHSDMTVEGSIYSADGDVKFGSGESNIVKGNITLNSNKNYIEENPHSLPEIHGNVSKISDTVFPYEDVTLRDYPIIVNKVDDYSIYWSPTPVTFNQSTHFKNLTIGFPVEVDTTNGDIYFVVDNFTLSGTGKIEIKGNNNLYLFVNSGINLSSGAINPGGDSRKVSMFVNGPIVIDGSVQVYANLFVKSDNVLIRGSGTLYGNIFTTARQFETYGQSIIHGTVYAPSADVTVYGSRTIYGRLIAKSLEIYGTGSIVYDSRYTDITVPDAAVKHRVNVVPESSDAGLVTVLINGEVYCEDQPYASVLVNYGDTVTITVAAKDGYKFVKYQDIIDGNDISDNNAELTITKDKEIRIVFEADNEQEDETQPDDGITGDEIDLSSAQYAYIFGYEPIFKTVTDEEGNTHHEVVELIMAMDDYVTREQVCAMVMRMIDQAYNTSGIDYPITPNIAKHRGTWYIRGLSYMASKGAFDGIETVNVGNVTRGEVAKLICYGLNLSKTTQTTFKDIDDSPYAPYIKTMVAYGYMQGMSDEIFSPNSFMTRAEFCAMFNNITNRSNNGLIAQDGTKVTKDTYFFTDMNDPNHWAYEVCLKATSSYDQNGLIDINIRNRNIRNILDQFDSQLEH